VSSPQLLRDTRPAQVEKKSTGITLHQENSENMVDEKDSEFEEY
jgi:hypothetical protein